MNKQTFFIICVVCKKLTHSFNIIPYRLFFLAQSLLHLLLSMVTDNIKLYCKNKSNLLIYSHCVNSCLWKHLMDYVHQFQWTVKPAALIKMRQQSSVSAK